jgi:heme exporter protein D
MSIWWNNWADFWAMGKHGLYVWGSYGMAALVVIAELWQAHRARQMALREVQQAHLAHAQEHP